MHYNFAKAINDILISIIFVVLIVGTYLAFTINIHSLPWIIAAVFNFSLAIFVYNKNRASKLNKSFAVFITFVGIWTLNAFELYVVKNELSAFHYSRFLSIGLIFIPVTFLHFITIFTKSNSRIIKIILYSTYGFAALFLILSLAGILVKEYVWVNWKYFPKPSIQYKLLIFYFAFLMIFSFVSLFVTYKQIKSFKFRNQLRYFFLAIFVGTAFGIINFLNTFGIKTYPLGGVGNILCPAILAYAIVKHQLMDIQIIIRKSVIYGTLTLSIVGIYALIVGSMTAVFGEITRHNGWLVNGLAGLTIAIVFIPLRDRIQIFIDKLFFKAKYDYYKTLSNFSASLISIIRLDHLLELLVSQITETIQIENAFIMLYDSEKEIYYTAFQSETNKYKGFTSHFRIDKTDKIVTWFEKNRKIIYLDEQNNLSVNILKQMGIALCIPLISKNKLIGIFNLGRKLSEDMYTQEDFELLSSIANQAAIAIENAQFYVKMRYWEKDLMLADKFSALGTFAASVAHEIKNPLTAIKTFSQLLYNRFLDKEFIDKFNNIVPKEIERLENVLGQILRFDKAIDTNYTTVDIVNVLDNLIGLLNYEAFKQNIPIKKNYEENILKVIGNEEQLKQIFMNLVLNAMQAMPKGGELKILAAKARSSNNQTSGYIEISITDTGCGIPKESLVRIFKPFYTTKENGTGLGLSIVKKIVTEHNGFIEVQSEPNKGTTFIIKLPKYDSNNISLPLQKPSLETSKIYPK